MAQFKSFGAIEPTDLGEARVGGVEGGQRIYQTIWGLS